MGSGTWQGDEKFCKLIESEAPCLRSYQNRAVLNTVDSFFKKRHHLLL